MENLISFQKKHPTWTAAIIILVVCVLLWAVFTCCLPVLLLFFSFGSGALVSFFLLGRDVLLPNLVSSRVRSRNQDQGRDDELTMIKKTCPVCGKQHCARHRPELNLVALQPWTNVKLPKRVNDALEEFFNLVLKDFVYAWYKDLSQDEAFTDEIRTSLRFIASVLLRRLQKVDIPTLITHKVLNAAMRHLHVCLRATKTTGYALNPEQAVLDLYGSNLHCAAHNRRAELDYLKILSSKIFPYVLPTHSLMCKSLCALLREILSGAILLPAMDVLADPDKLNMLLLLFLDSSRSHDSSELPSPLVPILEGYSHPTSKRNHASLHLKLADLIAKQEYLFIFMQFMKAEASINVLQFYLSIEEFNRKLLTPELSAKDMKDLHQELVDLYRMYIDPDSIDCIHLEDDIISQIQSICQGPCDGVVKLQTTTPLFRAHEHAYSLLENTFLPLFHQSDDYYTMLCGERLPTKLQRSSSKSAKRSNEALTSRLSRSIKGVFKTNLEEGRPVCDDIEYALEDCDFTSVRQELLPSTNSVMHVAPGEVSDTLIIDSPLRNLSAWRVSIPEVQLKPDPDNPKKTIFVFAIEVRRVDVLEKLRQLQLLQQLQLLLPQKRQLLQLPDETGDSEPSNWTIDRKYNEFYVLGQKLAEFHGDLDDVVLPPKKTFVQKNKAFFESQRDGFEMYLKNLLTKPVLRGSELIYSFLTSDQEFTTNFLDVNLGKKVKHGVMKITKERGQHLEPFLKSLLLSTENPKSRPSHGTDGDPDTISISSEMMSNSIYGNNANVDLPSRNESSPSNINGVSNFSDAMKVVNETSVEHLTSVYDTILYLALHVYLAPLWLLKVFMMIRIVLRNTFDTFLDWYLGYRLERVIEEHRVTKIIHLLRDALFFDSDPPRSDEDKKRRRDDALRELIDYIPRAFVWSVGHTNFKEGTELIVNFLQQPRLNKQLSYVLLDQVLEELFPELFCADDTEVYYDVSE